MAHFLDRHVDRAEAAEVERLVNELVAEIGGREVRAEIHSLALKLQALLDEREAKDERV